MINKLNQKITKKWIGISYGHENTYCIHDFIQIKNHDLIHPKFKSINDITSLYLNPNILNYIDFCKSPTSCDFLSEPEINGEKKYFYVDQQDLVKWFVTNTKYVYAEFNGQIYVVANNISEFLELMHLENYNYYSKLKLL
jgi:hypothetical protein